MDLPRIRYRGDKKDVELLFRDYNLEGIISTSEERQKMEESNFRNQLLKDGAKNVKSVPIGLDSWLADISKIRPAPC